MALFLAVPSLPFLLIAAGRLFLVNPALFIFRDEPAAFADFTQDLAADDFLSEAAQQLLLRFVISYVYLWQNSLLSVYCFDY